jgi:hypothetical protein
MLKREESYSSISHFASSKVFRKYYKNLTLRAKVNFFKFTYKIVK